MKRDLTSICDLSRDEIGEIFEISTDLKSRLAKGEYPKLLKDKVLAMVFEKPSLRTRCTFEIGMFQLGGHAVNLQATEVGLGKRESVSDIARNLERWTDMIIARTFKQSTVDALAKHSSVPVINALSDEEHPCQAFADLLTLKEHRGALEGLTLAYIGDGNNVCHSLVLLCAKVGVNVSVATPKGYEPNSKFVEMATENSRETNCSLVITNDPVEAVAHADAVYTDVWASMGQEDETEERKKVFADYQINAELIAHAPSSVLIMHCLPAHRGEEITSDVLDSPNSIVFDEAENRLHAQKGIMVFLDRCSGPR